MIPPVSRDIRLLGSLRSVRAACGGAALVAGAFSAVVAAGVLWNLIRTPADPQADAAFVSLKADLVRTPDSERIRQEIRAADLRLRQEFFHRRQTTRRGAFLLTGGAAVLIAALGLLLAAPPQPRKPPSGTDEEEGPRRFAAWGRLGVLGLGLLLAGGAVGWAALGAGAWMPPLSARPPDSPQARAPATRQVPRPLPTAMAASLPGWEDIQQNWPRFRGPLGAGVYDGQAPTRWDANTGQGILWKRELPLEGHSSPIVWGGRVVVTAADKDVRKVLCLDADDGRLLWEKEVKTADSPAKPPKVSEETGFAAPSPATDGNCFCAIFPNGDIACFDPNGQERWSRNLRPEEEETDYGYASSLDLVEGLVIVQMDRGLAERGKSRLLALDAKTGAVTWEAPRPVSGSWTSPIVVPLPGHVAVLALGNPYLIAHDLEDGSELWRSKVGGGDGAPSPVLAGGLAFAVRTNYQVSALRPDGSGDVTETHLAWKSEEDIPDIASPLGDGNRLWTLTTPGYLVCYEAATGRRLGERELKGQFQASPSLAGGRLYLLSDTGTMFILEADAEMRPVAQCELGERTVASPAFFHGRIYIRGEQHLFCIGSNGKEPGGG